MPGAPIYTSQVDAPGPGYAPQVQPSDAISRVVGRLGETFSAIGLEEARAKYQTEMTGAESQFLAGLQDLQFEAVKNPDYRNTPSDFASAVDKLKGDVLAGVGNDAARQSLGAALDRQVIMASGKVKQAAWQHEASANIASATTADQADAMRYVGAGSDPERQTIMDGQRGRWDALAKAGWISAETAVARQHTFAATSTEGWLTKLTLDNPRVAKELLEDQARPLAISPERRAIMAKSAAAALDSQSIEEIKLKAAAFPEDIGRLLGRLDTPDAVRDVYSRVVAPVRANLMKVGSEWGDPRAPDFEAQNIVGIAAPNGQALRVNRNAAVAFQGFLRDLAATGYKIRDIGGFNVRTIAGSDTLSQHAFGNAIDLNPEANPVYSPLGVGKTDLPANVRDIAAKWGLSWGNDWTSKKDPMHFEWSGAVTPAMQDLAKAEGVALGRGAPVEASTAPSFQDWAARVSALGGRVAPALASLHAAPEKVRAWAESAEQKGGAAFTPADFLAVIDDPAVRAKVETDLAALKVPGDAYGLSRMGRMKAELAYRETVKQSVAASRKMADALAAAAGQAPDDLIAVLNDGNRVDPGVMADTRARLTTEALTGNAGAAKQLSDLNDAEVVAQAILTARGRPPAELDGWIDDMHQGLAAGTVENRQLKVVHAVEAVRDDIRRAKDADVVSLAERNGRLVAQPVVDASGAIAFADLARRSDQALAAGAFYGAAPNPFTRQEADTLRQHWASMSNQDRAVLTTRMASSMDERVFRAGVGQIADGKAAETAMIAGLIGRDAPEVAEKVFRGTALLEEKGADPKVDDIRSALKATLPSSLFPAEVHRAVADAALAVYAADRGAGGKLHETSDVSALKGAVEQIVGKMAKRNGAAFPLPPGLTDGAVSAALDQLSAEDLKDAGGAFLLGGIPADPSFLADHAVLVPTGLRSSAFKLYVPGPDGLAPVLTSNRSGGAVQIDLAELVARHPKKPGWW